ncbi:MAG: tryptophan synthase subunit alpha [candidate division Zixibacteria bacterium]|nr:tryptophan synthase subunit alpha [candidate division Zixibacteria bacterium]
MTNRVSTLIGSPNRRKLLVPFVTVGYPTFAMSRQLAETAIESGADMLELGMPFSDPLADGPQVQLSSQVALQHGTGLGDLFELTAELRRGTDIPILAMGYYNPVLSRGLDRFFGEAKSAGIDGLIIPDLPPEEAGPFLDQAGKHDIASVFLVAPTSTAMRVRRIEQRCTDFVYAVTVTGVTGAGRSFDDQTDRYLSSLRKQLRKPFVAGFGVSSSASAKRLCRHADGVVIGSALIRLVEENGRAERAVGKVGDFLKSVRESLNGQ